MNKYELPLLILASSVLFSYVIELSLWQGTAVTMFAGAVYFTGRRMMIERRD